MRLTSCLSAFALLAAGPAFAQTSPRIAVPRAAAPLELSPEQRQQLNEAVQRGRLLAAIDHAGRISTRDLLTRFADPSSAGITGWVAEPEGNAISVTYYARIGGAPEAPARSAPAAEPAAAAPAAGGAGQADSGPSAAELAGALNDPAGTELAGEAPAPAPEAPAATTEAAPAEPATPAIPAEPERYVAVYRAQVLAGRVSSPQVFPADARPPLTGNLERMARARQAVTALDHPTCNRESANALVLPPAGADAPVIVYEVSARITAGRIPAGGQYRTIVAPDGSTDRGERIGGECEEVALPPAPTQAGGRPRPLIVNARDAGLPNEIHVFLSGWTGRPVVLATGTTRVRLWGVTTDGIGELRE